MSKFKFKTTKYVGKIKKYSRSAGRANDLSNYDYLEVGDNYLTGLEINKTLDHIESAYNNGDEVTLMVSGLVNTGEKGIFGLGIADKFYSPQGSGSSQESSAMLGFMYVFMKVFPLLCLAALIVGYLIQSSGLFLFGLIGGVIGLFCLLGKNFARAKQGAIRLSVYQEFDRIATEAQQDGFKVIRVPLK